MLFAHDLSGKPLRTLRQRGPPASDHASGHARGRCTVAVELFPSDIRKLTAANDGLRRLRPDSELAAGITIFKRDRLREFGLRASLHLGHSDEQRVQPIGHDDGQEQGASDIRLLLLVGRARRAPRLGRGIGHVGFSQINEV